VTSNDRPPPREDTETARASLAAPSTSYYRTLGNSDTATCPDAQTLLDSRTGHPLSSRMMKLIPGNWVWIACEVKPGPFPDERTVKVPSDGGEDWVGFVTADSLREPIESGWSFVNTLVVDVQDGTFLGRLPGDGLGTSLVRLPASSVQADGGPIAP
jgi:hypothetical protein